MKKPLKYFSLFSGIGGFELGINQAYENLQNILRSNKSKHEAKNSTKLGQTRMDADVKEFRLGHPICTGYSEIDKYAIQIYQKHFPNHKNYGDITKINPKKLPDFDLIVGGFPCQSFSIAGKRKGFEDTRGTLFFEIARIIKVKKPRLVLLENVKGLLSHDNGKTFSTIIAALDELGYDVQWQVLNSKNFGVPQNRERVFIVGNLRRTARPEVFPFAEANANNLKEITTGTNEASRVYKTEGISRTIKNGGGQGAKTGLYQVVPTIRASDYKRGDNQTAVVEDFYPDRIRQFKDSPTLRGDRAGLKVKQQRVVRRLTPVECERLQGFPDGWTKTVSDTQRYKTCGNAVTTKVVQAIIEKLLI